MSTIDKDPEIVGLIAKAAEIWNDLADIYDKQEIDSKRDSVIFDTVHALAKLHPKYDRFHRRVVGVPTDAR